MGDSWIFDNKLGDDKISDAIKTLNRLRDTLPRKYRKETKKGFMK